MLFCQGLQPVLTLLVVYLVISFIVPVYSMAGECNVTLLPVEDKNVELKHYDKCNAIDTAQIIWSFQTICVIVPKIWEIRRYYLNGNMFKFSSTFFSKSFFFLRNTRDRHVYMWHVSYCHPIHNKIWVFI